MDENNFQIMLQAVLDKIKSIANIKENIKAIEPKLPKIKLQGTLNSTTTKKELNSKLKSIKPKVKIDADTTQAEKKIRKINQQKTSPTITPTVDNSQVVSGLKQAQKETKTLWDRFTNGMMGINLIRMGVQEVVRAIRQAIAGIKELDTIKTNIQMVSGTSDSGVNAMMSAYNSMAKNLSSTTKEVGEAANEFLRMGESIESTNELIKSSQVLSKVGMIESSEAASYLISSLKGYQVAAQDSMDIVSKLTSVDLEAAVSAGGLAEALSKCANIANNSGIAMDRLIGYTATIGETTQKSMSEVGNSLQSLLSRMNNIKIGRFIDDETGESLSDTEAVLNKLGIQLRDAEDSYRSFDDVLDDVGKHWDTFNKVEQNAISVAIAGTRQRENFEALMNNYGNALKYAETAANSAGSALERYSVYQDSIEAKTNELTAAMESLSTNVISEELYSGIIEATTGVVELIDKANLLKGTLAGLVTMGISKAFVSMATGIISATKSTAQLTAAMTLFDNGRSIQNLKAIGKACIGLNDSQLKLVLSTKGLTTVQKLSILEGMGLEAQERQQTLATLGFSAAEDKATVSTLSFKGALNSLRTVIAMNPFVAIATAVSAVTIAFSVYKQHQEEVRQATEEAANAYKESSKSIDDYASKYQELHKALIAAKGNEEETYNIKKQLLELQTELNDKFGDEYGAINLVTEAYKDQTEAIKALNKETAQTFLNENKEGIDKSVKEMTKDRHYNLSYTGMIATTDKGKILKEIAEKYTDQGISILDEGDGGVTFSVHLNTDAQSAYDTINAFETDLRNKAIELGDEHMFDDVLDISSESLNKAKDTIGEYGEIYKQALTAEIVADSNKSKVYSEALKAVEAYNDAVLRAENPYDDQNVTQAKENLDTIKDSIQGNEEEWEKYSTLFDDVFSQADTRLIEFNEALKTDDGLKELANDLEGFNDIDLQALDENVGENNSFDKLKETAEEYDVSVNELIDTLIRLGYVQAEIQRTKEIIEEPVSLSISQTIDQLNTQLKPAFDSLKSAYQDIFTDDGFTLNSIDILSTCDSIKSKLDDMSELGLNVDYSAFEDFVRVLNNTESTENDVENSFNSLASSITQAALSGTEDFETMKAALEDLGVVNNEMVAFGALVSNTEMLDEALSEANISMDDFIVNAEEGTVQATKAGQAFLEEKVGAENCAEALSILAFHKELCNLQEMNTAGEVANLKTLAENAGYTGEVIQYLTELEQIYQEVASGTLNAFQVSAKVAKAIALKAMIEAAASKVNYEPKVDFSGATKAAKSAGKSAGDAYKDGLKEALSDIESVISGITGKIDDNISSINSQKSAALDAIDAEKEALESAKEAAVEALEEERQKRLDVIETQRKQIEQNIKAKQKVIDQINDEIKAMRDANDERKRQNDLMKAQYELEKLQHQRTILQYSEDKGMHYVTNTKDIRSQKQAVDDAKLEIAIANKEKEIDLIEKEIDLLNEKLDLLDEQENEINDYYDKLISETEKFYDQQLKNLEKQRKETESYFESLIKNLENSKSKFQELTELLEKAELSAKLKQLGIDEEALLNGSEEEFEKLKQAYLDIVFKLNEGNDEVLNSLRELSGYDGTAPALLSDSNSELDTMNGKLDESNQSVGNVNSSLGETASTTSEVASNVSDLESNLSTVNGTISEEQTAFENLKQKINEVIEAINQKTEAIQNEQNVVGIATSSEMADFLLLKEKILEVRETLESFGTPEEGLISSIASAIESLNDISLDEGIIAQFNNLKEAIDSVTSAISGGGGESSGGEGQGSGSGKGGESGGKGSEGEGGGNSLTGAINEMGKTANEVIGEADAEGDGTVIGEFGSMETAVNDVTTAIGGDSEGGGGSSGDNEGNLIGSIVDLGETTEETLGEPGGDGVIRKFEELKQPIQEADEHVHGISDGLDAIDGKEVECTIKVNIETNGSLPAFASGTLGNMNLESGEYTAKYGKAFAEGTGKYKGLPNDEKNALVSEYGQTEMTVLPNGNTIITDEPTMMDLPKGTVIYNEDQTKQIMDNKVDAKIVKSYANGTIEYSDGTIVTPEGVTLRPPQPGERAYELQKAFEPFVAKILKGEMDIVSNAVFDGQKQMERWTKEITNNTAISNVTNNNKNVQQPVVHNEIHVTLPNVTNSTSAESLLRDLESLNTKKYQVDW